MQRYFGWVLSFCIGLSACRTAPKAQKPTSPVAPPRTGEMEAPEATVSPVAAQEPAAKADSPAVTQDQETAYQSGAPAAANPTIPRASQSGALAAANSTESGVNSTTETVNPGTNSATTEADQPSAEPVDVPVVPRDSATPLSIVSYQLDSAMLSAPSVNTFSGNSLSSVCHTTSGADLPRQGDKGEKRCLVNVKAFLASISPAMDVVAVQDTAALGDYTIPGFIAHSITMADVQLRTYLTPGMASTLKAQTNPVALVSFPFQSFLFDISGSHVVLINAKFSKKEEIETAILQTQLWLKKTVSLSDADRKGAQFIVAGGFNGANGGIKVKEIYTSAESLLYSADVLPFTAGFLATPDLNIFTIQNGYSLPAKTSTIQDHVMSTKKPTSVVVYRGEIGNKAPKSNHLPILAVVPLQ